MFSAVHISELLTKNVDQKLYPRAFIMSPNGTLMAYSTPIDIKQLRDQAALISMAWKDPASSVHTTGGPSTSHVPLVTLTVEADNANILIRALQQNLLLVLIGNVPPTQRSARKFKMTAEAKDDPRYPVDSLAPKDSSDHDDEQGPHASSPPADANAKSSKTSINSASTLSQRQRDIKLGALHMQRKKLDALAAYITADFEATGFVMPDEAGFA